jgi:cytochrome c5
MKALKLLLSMVLLIVLSSFIFTQKSVQQKFVITEKDIAWADSVWKGTTLADLNNGEVLYTKSCNRCHGYKNPQSRSAEKWNRIIPKMSKKAKLSNDEELLLLKFVITEGRERHKAK